GGSCLASCQRRAQSLDAADKFLGRIRLRAGHAPYRPRPRDVLVEARDHVHVQLRHHVAQRGHVELVRLELGLQQATGAVDFAGELRLLGVVQVRPFHRVFHPRHYDQPGMVGVVHQLHVAQGEVRDGMCIVGQLRMQVPAYELRRAVHRRLSARKSRVRCQARVALAAWWWLLSTSRLKAWSASSYTKTLAAGCFARCSSMSPGGMLLSRAPKWNISGARAASSRNGTLRAP